MRSSPRVALLLLVALLTACAPRQSVPPGATSAPSSTTGRTVELTIFAAASLTDAFQEIGKKFEATAPGTRIAFNFAGSQQLAQQIVQGAPADVFASANTQQMNVVIQAGQVADNSPRIFARNRLVVIYPVDNPARLTTLPDLARPGVKIVLADKAVPVGQYAVYFLGKASADATFGSSYKDAVLKNVVSYEQNVKAVLSKVQLGEADAGIVYTTDVTPDAADKVGRIDIPDQYNTIAAYPIATIKGSKHADLAEQFVTYVLSANGQTILAKYGFIPTDARPMSARLDDGNPRAALPLQERLAWASGSSGLEVR